MKNKFLVAFIGILLVIVGVNGRYQTAMPSAAAVHLPAIEPQQVRPELSFLSKEIEKTVAVKPDGCKCAACGCGDCKCETSKVCKCASCQAAKQIEAVSAPVKTNATITVNVPSDAVITIDGNATTSTSAVRTFETPALAVGQTFYYRFTVDVVRDGRTLRQTQTVAVQAGSKVSVTITPTTTNAVPPNFQGFQSFNGVNGAACPTGG